MQRGPVSGSRPVRGALGRGKWRTKEKTRHYMMVRPFSSLTPEVLATHDRRGPIQEVVYSRKYQ
jgi:hypothetical protein